MGIPVLLVVMGYALARYDRWEPARAVTGELEHDRLAGRRPGRLIGPR